MSIKELSVSLKQFNDKFNCSKEIAEDSMESQMKKLEPQIAEIFANALTVALAQVENLVQKEFESSNQAFEFTNAMLLLLKHKYRDRVSKAMRRFDRLGSHRTAVIFKKKLQSL